jgi:GT2 family glycosyltransferase
MIISQQTMSESLPAGFAVYAFSSEISENPHVHRYDSTLANQQFQAFLSATSSEWVAVIEGNVAFLSVARELISKFVAENPEVEMFYSDSIGNSKTSGSFLRTDYCSEKLRSVFYLGPVVFYKVELLLRILPTLLINPAFPTYSLALRSAADASTVGHLKNVLYKQTSSKGSYSEVQQEALKLIVENHLNNHGGGSVDWVSSAGIIGSRRVPHGTPLVSIVIPTRAIYSQENGLSTSLVIDAVKSIIEKTTYQNFEIVLVADSVAEEAVLSQLREIAGAKLKLISWDKPFNFSQKMNYGVLHAAGEYVLLLNDDVEVITPDWLGDMLGLAQLPNTGMVGAMLYYEDDTIQHAGHAYYKGSPTHVGLGLPRGAAGVENSFQFDRRVSGVTAACALMPLNVFKEVGGFTPLLPGNFNDVDLCQKVDWLGYNIYWTPRAELYHFESKTRDAHVHFYELDVIEHRWGLRLDDDRFWRGHPYA